MPKAPARPRLLLAASLVLAAAGLGPAAALGSGNDLYASPGGAASGSCSASAPCQLAYAVAQAAAGDTVVVTPGTYNLTSGLSVAKAITVEGEAGQPRPSLVGASTLASDTVDASAGATLDHLDIEATNDSSVTSAHTAALSADGGTLEDLTLSAGAKDKGGEALKVTTAGTTVSTVLAVNSAFQGTAVSFIDSSAGTGSAAAINLTAVNTGSGGVAIWGNVARGSVAIKNAIAYDTGSGTAVSTRSGTHPLSISYSDFPSASAGVTAGPGNLSARPAFADGAYREAGGSPTIGAGAGDPSMTPADLDGRAWPATAPDMGAYEFAGSTGGGTGSSGSSGTGSGTTTSGAAATHQHPAHPAHPTLPPQASPVADVSVTLHRSAGTVKVKLPGSAGFVALARAAELPVGTVIDATRGRVALTSAVTAGGATKTGTFSGGRFAVTQSRGARPLTNLRLVGGSFAACTRPVAVHLPGLAAGNVQTFLRAVRRPRHRVVRQLWGSDHGGRFVTIGRSASAAVRGTVWLTQDRCDGTLVRVLRGRVLVHDARRHRTVTVRAGHSYLARGRS